MTFNVLAKRISLVTLLSGSFLAVVYACGWYPDESDFLSFMSPSVVNQPKTEHLNFEPSYEFYWSAMSDKLEAQAGLLVDSNVYEWQQYMSNGNVPVSDIQDVIYKMPLATLLEVQANMTMKKKSPLPDSLANNNMLIWLSQKKNRAALDYVVFAKKSEELSNLDYNPWEPVKIATTLAEQTMAAAMKEFGSSKEPFLKSRYAFQAMKAAFYGALYNNCIDLWDSHAKQVQGQCPSLDHRMLSYRAGAMYRSGRKAEAAYWFSKMFDESNNFNDSYGHSLGFIWSKNETPVEQVIPFCKTAHERSVVFALAGMREVEPFRVNDIEKVYAEEPMNPMLDVLLLREINKAELAYLDMRANIERGYYVYDGWTGGPLFGLNEEAKQSDLFKKNGVPQPLQAFSAYVNRMAKTEKVANPALWKMSAGYLAYMCENYTDAKYWYMQTARSNPSKPIQDQLAVLNLLYELRQSGIPAIVQESRLLAGLEQVEQLASTNAAYKNVFRGVLRSELPAYFVRKNDTLRMMLSYHRFENTYNEPSETTNQAAKHFSDFSFSNSGTWMNKYFSQEQLDAVVVMQHNNSNALDRWLLKGNEYNERIVRELKGVKYFRGFDYEKALSILKGQNDLPVVPDIFHMYVNDYQAIPVDDLEQQYTTAEVLEQLIALKKKAPSDAYSAYRYASILYSLSYHGRCHKVWNFYRDYTDVTPYYFSKEEGMYTPFEMQYFYADEAYTWFRKAFEKSNDPIIKQNALWMMAKCEQKRCPLEAGNPYWNDNDANNYVAWNLNQNTWLALFYKNYKGTPFYNKVFEECAYLQLFAAKH